MRARCDVPWSCAIVRGAAIAVLDRCARTLNLSSDSLSVQFEYSRNNRSYT